MYNKLNEGDIAYLSTLLPPERVITQIGPDYSHDELSGTVSYPDLLLRVRSTEEVSAVMRYAYERNIPVVVRGQGTGLVGAAVATHGGIMLEMTQMNRILELDRDNMTVTAEPGVLLMELAAFAEENGFLYPPDPGEKTATIGGNISTNAGGMRAVKYGVTRDFVRGLTVVLPNGEVLELGGKVVKSSTGYSLINLVIGSEGTLCVITRAILKLIPLPSVNISLLLPYDDFDAAIDTVPRLMRSGGNPVAVEFFERETILFSERYLGKRFPDASSPAYVLLTFDGNDAESVERDYTEAAKLALECGASDAYIVDTPERKESVWSARSAFLEAIKASTTEMDECDVVVPRSRVAEFIKFSHALSAETGVRIPGFGHAGDGNLHLYICRDGLSQEAWEAALSEIFVRLYERAAQCGGLVSGEHGIGYAKKEYMRERLGDAQIELMRGIKRAFDEKGILNPGKLF